MTFDSNTETVAILYDIENAPFEMLDYALGKARKYLPCRIIVVSDWEQKPDQKRWNRLFRRQGITFRQIERTKDGKNSLDYALFDTAALLHKEGVEKFFIITTDSDFASIVTELKRDSQVHVIGIGTEQANQLLRDSYDEFLSYQPPGQQKNKESVENINPKKKKLLTQAPAVQAVNEGNLNVVIPKTLYKQLLQRQADENVDLNQLITYLLMRGIND